MVIKSKFATLNFALIYIQTNISTHKPTHFANTHTLIYFRMHIAQYNIFAWCSMLVIGKNKIENLYDAKQMP